MTDHQFDTTHAPGCWSWGPRHYECAVREIERLLAEMEVWKASFEQAASGHATYAERTEQLLAENERLRDEVERLRTDGANAVRWAPSSAHWSEVLKELFGPDARNGIDVLETRWRKELERAERLAEVLSKILENEASDWKAAEEFGGYVLDVELREEARAVLSKENTNET